MKQEYKDMLDLDIENLEPMPLTKEQKAAMKSRIMKKTRVKKPYRIGRVAAAVFLGASVLTASFMTIPAIANQIPFVQNILSYFEDDALPNSYTDLAEFVNQVQSSNGIDIMIENAVYDGTNVFVTYAIQTDIDLGKMPRADGFLNVEPASGSGGTGTVEKINETTYVGVEKVTPHFDEKSPEKVIVEWEPLAFWNYETNKQFEGDWKFEFTLVQLPTNIQLLEETGEQDGIKVAMKSIEESEMTAVLQYEYFVDETLLEKWPFISVELADVKDNLGNEYEINGNGGVSHHNGTVNQSRATIYSLHPDANSLTMTPEIFYANGSGEVVEVKKMKPITIKIK
jgi:hypothetical protein